MTIIDVIFYYKRGRMLKLLLRLDEKNIVEIMRQSAFDYMQYTINMAKYGITEEDLKILDDETKKYLFVKKEAVL